MGRVAYGIAEAEMRVNALVLDVIDELDLQARRVPGRACRFNIGSGGKRLTASQRQKLALARAMLRRPDFLLVHRALSQLDGRGQAAIVGRVLALAREGGDGRLSACCGTWKIRRLAQPFRPDHPDGERPDRRRRAARPRSAGRRRGRCPDASREPMRISA